MKKSHKSFKEVLTSTDNNYNIKSEIILDIFKRVFT